MMTGRNRPSTKHLALRAKVLRLLRRALDGRGYLEVETPSRVRSPGTDVNIEAFASEDRWLITSPEFHLKRLLAAGMKKIYRIGSVFRKGERTGLHNPEFTLLEFYGAGLTWEGMIGETEAIIGEVVDGMGRTKTAYQGRACDLRAPWKRLSVDDAFRAYAGWSPLCRFDEDRFYFDLVDKVERRLGVGSPTVLHHYPAPLAMLAKISEEDPRAALRFEVYVCGVELANAFEELTDPQEQRRRFERDLEQRRLRGLPEYPIDDVFLEALGDLPPCSGTAVGVDRLVMLIAGAENLDEVIAFPDERV